MASHRTSRGSTCSGTPNGARGSCPEPMRGTWDCPSNVGSFEEGSSQGTSSQPSPRHWILPLCGTYTKSRLLRTGSTYFTSRRSGLRKVLRASGFLHHHVLSRAMTSLLSLCWRGSELSGYSPYLSFFQILGGYCCHAACRGT